MKKALVTGVTGQDGSYLAELLIGKGYQVDGLVRRLSVPNRANIQYLLTDTSAPFKLIEGDLEDPTRISGIIKDGQYDEVYNLGAMSFVHYSFDNPVQVANTNYLGNVYLLDAIRRDSPQTKFYQASTSEMYGGLSADSYNEDSAFHPRSPYGVAKLAAYWNTRNARDGYGIFACNGILFNHESPRRGKEFVTQKVAQGVARIRAKMSFSSGAPDMLLKDSDVIELGNLDGCRDWGHAKDYVRGMYMMMQHDTPDDYVLATGTAYSVRQLCEFAFGALGLNLCWSHDLSSGYLRIDGKLIKVVTTNDVHKRPTEVDILIGDAMKAESVLGWEPEYSFKRLVREMVNHAQHGID
jgi:GDPmannose 4,6-dehydratase